MDIFTVNKFVVTFLKFCSTTVTPFLNKKIYCFLKTYIIVDKPYIEKINEILIKIIKTEIRSLVFFALFVVFTFIQNFRESVSQKLHF